MKGKKGIYILLPAVALLWGYIGYKIYNQVKTPEQGIAEPVFKALKFEPKTSKQSFELNLRYADPFLKQTEKVQKEADGEISAKNKKRTWIWPQITYKGCIENHKKTVGMLRLNNKEYLVQNGMLIEKFTIKRIDRDSLIVEREGERRSFSIPNRINN